MIVHRLSTHVQPMSEKRLHRSQEEREHTFAIFRVAGSFHEYCACMCSLRAVFNGGSLGPFHFWAIPNRRHLAISYSICEKAPFWQGIELGRHTCAPLTIFIVTKINLYEYQAMLLKTIIECWGKLLESLKQLSKTATNAYTTTKQLRSHYHAHWLCQVSCSFIVTNSCTNMSTKVQY